MSQIGEAYVRVRPDLTGFRGETARGVTRDMRGVERQLASTHREFGRFSRGALVGTGALRELGRAAAFASLSFIGGAGLVVGIKSTISAAMDAQVVLGQTRNAVRRAGLSWEEYGEQIQVASLAQAQLSGFDDERLLRTFSTFVRRTGDATRALKLNALAANVARGRNIELEQAAQLVLKATLGQAGALRRLGIDAKVGASGLELVALLTQKYSGSVEEFANTAAGAQARFSVAIGETQEAIGTALLPAITDLLNKGTEWLNDTDNQERLQRTLASTVDITTTAVGGLATAVGGLSDAYRILTNLPGGDTGLVDLFRGIPFLEEGSRKLGDDIYRIGDALGLVDTNTRRAITAQDLLWAKAKRQQLTPDTGIFGIPSAFLNQIPTDQFPQPTSDADRTSTPARRRSPAATRDQQTAIDLARAEAEGTKAQIVAAANARLAFIRETIAFANKLIAQGRGDTKALSATLQKFYSEESSTVGILEQIDRDAADARDKRIEDAKAAALQRAQEATDAYESWKEARIKEADAIVAGVAKANLTKALRAANEQERRETQEAIQDQVVANNLIAAQLIPNVKKRLAAEKTATQVQIDLWRSRAKLYGTQTLAGQQAIGEMRAAKLALLNLGKETATSTKGGKGAAGGGFSLQELFAEAGDEFAMYGSNIGGPTSPLSRQDARASFAGTVKTNQTTVIQNFNYPVAASQALNDAKNAAKNLK